MGRQRLSSHVFPLMCVGVRLRIHTAECVLFWQPLITRVSGTAEALHESAVRGSGCERNGREHGVKHSDPAHHHHSHEGSPTILMGKKSMSRFPFTQHAHHVCVERGHEYEDTSFYLLLLLLVITSMRSCCINVILRVSLFCSPDRRKKLLLPPAQGGFCTDDCALTAISAEAPV